MDTNKLPTKSMVNVDVSNSGTKAIFKKVVLKNLVIVIGSGELGEGITSLVNAFKNKKGVKEV